MESTITDAMIGRKTISFIYHDKPRTVEVHALGRSTKDGALVMRAFQVEGEREGWALFRLDEVDDLVVGERDSLAPRPGYKPGDRQMREIIHELHV